MSDNNRVDVSINVSSDGAERGAAKASDSIARAVGLMQRDLQQLVQQSQATTSAMTQGFAQMSSSSEAAANRMVQASQRVRAAHESEAKAAEGASHWTAASRRELLVLAHELSMGNYKRFAGSIMVLGEQMDWMHKIMTPAGLAIGAVAGSVALASAVTYKAAEAMADYGEAVHKTSQVTGASTDAIQQWVFAAHAAGVNAKETVESFGKLAEVQNRAVHGNKVAADAFAALGISLNTLRSSTPNDLLAKIADAFHNSADGAGKAAVANELFGASGANLIPLLDRGSAGLAQLGVEARNAGAIIGGETIEQMAAMKEQMDLAHARMDAMSMSAKTVLLPTILNLTSALSDNAALKPILEDFYNGVSEVVKGAASVLATLVVGAEQAGIAISTVAEAAHRAGAGDFSGIVATVKSGFHDIETAGDHYRNFIQKVWSDTAAPATVHGATGTQQINFSKGTPRGNHGGEVTPTREYAYENAQTQAKLNALKEDLKAQQSELDRSYKLQEVSLRDYYLKRLEITLTGMDAERAAVKEQLDQTKALEGQARNPAERLSLKTKEVEINGRLAVMDRQRAAAAVQGSQEMQAAIAAETKGLEDLAAKRANAGYSQAQQRAMLVAEEEVRQGRMTQAQLIELERQFEEQKTSIAIQAIQHRLDTEKSLTRVQQQELQDQQLQLAQEGQTKQLQLSIAANDAQMQSAREATNSIEEGFSRTFASIVDGTARGKQAFANLFSSINQELTQLVTKSLFDKLSKMEIGGGFSADSLLRTGTSKLLGGDASGTAATTAHTTAVTADTTGLTAMTAAIAAATAALAALTASAGMAAAAKNLGGLAGAGGGLGGMFGEGTGGSNAWGFTMPDGSAGDIMPSIGGNAFGFTMPSFDVGTPFVPNDMIAQIHRGEAIVPAHMNSPYSPGNVSVSNQFVLPGGTDLRTQSQIAAMAGSSISQAMRRNG
ncbi:Bacteriophage tail tape measure N-terminal domain-containing protein [Burkholderia pseudomallei]